MKKRQHKKFCYVKYSLVKTTAYHILPLVPCSIWLLGLSRDKIPNCHFLVRFTGESTPICSSLSYRRFCRFLALSKVLEDITKRTSIYKMLLLSKGRSKTLNVPFIDILYIINSQSLAPKEQPVSRK